MKLLDTTFLIDYLAGDKGAEGYLESHEDEDLVTTSINIKELAVGVQLAGDERKHELLSRFGWLRIVPFTVDHAVRAGQLEADLRADDTIPSERIDALSGDILIAAVAADHETTVITRNTGDFEVLGVDCEAY
ncbi:type II toxin-antitoxin system VapC family toxin [Halonotius terrestris]|uniref:Type II toxin-antitoxin system VapC family toxin n=1 Tax=Halonotius terrestris TaxID=2487750 RepID=A0A8J8PCP9_9EURY|nr:type II toxin-antitoxin system VapC family toxin [Halonotius terrestris]TQQ82777.1 type II toxin-antitoxin system VapC family toxin [Halonotius terrestris]